MLTPVHLPLPGSSLRFTPYLKPSMAMPALRGWGCSGHPGQKDHTPWNGRKHTFIPAPTLPGPSTTAHSLVSTAHSPDLGERGPTTQCHRSPKGGCRGSTAGGDGEQGPDPEEQHRQRRQVSPGSGCGVPAMGWKQQQSCGRSLLRPALLLATEPSRRQGHPERGLLAQASWPR